MQLTPGTRYIKDYPDDRDSYFYAGLAEEHLRNNPGAALNWYEKAHQLIPVFYPVTKAIVDSQLKLGRPDMAVESLGRYLAQPHLDIESRQQAEARLSELASRP